MPLKKWAIQYSIAFPFVCALLGGLQFIRGRSLEYSIEFGVLWALISIAVFALRRAYNYKMHIHCGICDDLPQQERTDK